MIDWAKVTGFQWDDGNARKSASKHGVTQAEAEQTFFNEPLVLVPDHKYSQREPRYLALGITDLGRPLHIAFTLRQSGSLIRIISARDMHRTEKRGRLMSKQRKTTPEFETEAEERAFWESHDSSEYVDWSQAQRGRFPNLKPSTKTISLRLPQGLLDSIKIEAHRRDVPYQSLIKTWLAEHLDQERKR